MELGSPDMRLQGECLVGAGRVVGQSSCARRQGGHNFAMTLLSQKGFGDCGEERVPLPVRSQADRHRAEFPAVRIFVNPAAKRMGNVLMAETDAIDWHGLIRGPFQKILAFGYPGVGVVRRGR